MKKKGDRSLSPWSLVTCPLFLRDGFALGTDDVSAKDSQ